MASVYSDRILKYIDADSQYFTPLTAKKFGKAGEYFLDLAVTLDYSSQRWLIEWFNESYGENEYCEIDHDWEDWLASHTQQSVSVNFLAKYQGDCEASRRHRSGNDYPESRQGWSKEEEAELGIEREDDLPSLIATAHAEDIAQWSSLISDSLQGKLILFCIKCT